MKTKRALLLTDSVFAALTLYGPNPAAKTLIGHDGLESVAKIGSPLGAARAALGLDVIELSTGENGAALFAGGSVITGCDGVVFRVTRGLDDEPSTSWDTIFAISAYAGPPISRRVQMPAESSSSGEASAFTWPNIPDYEISVIRAGTGWTISEANSRPELCVHTTLTENGSAALAKH